MRKSLSALAIAVVALVGPLVGTAGADVVDPPGACVGKGTWTSPEKQPRTELSTAHVPSDLIHIPQADTVAWQGNIKGYKLGDTGPRRDIDGKVQVAVPFGKITIDDWGGTSVKYANEGNHEYDAPDVLIGIEMKVSGEHHDGGQLTCSGSVKMVIDGDNPLKIVAVVGMILTFALLMFSGRPVVRKIRAFEDENPG